MVVKAAIDLLLIFVNYMDPSDMTNSSLADKEPSPRLESPDSLPTNALLFKDAVDEVSEELRIPPWKYLLAIISEKSVADPEIMAKAMSLINKVGTCMYNSVCIIIILHKAMTTRLVHVY